MGKLDRLNSRRPCVTDLPCSYIVAALDLTSLCARRKSHVLNASTGGQHTTTGNLFTRQLVVVEMKGLEASEVS